MATKKATKKAATKDGAKKATKKASARKAKAPPAPLDPRESLAPTPRNLTQTVKDLGEILGALTVPAEPQPQDLVSAMLHFTFAEDVCCGIGQEAVRRLESGFVNRNELRLTEAFEIEEALQDLEIPNLFDRCLRARDSVAQIYNDQNAIDLSFLQEASVTDRNQFFQRVPAIQPTVAKYLVDLVSFEEILFSERSTLRVQQRMGLDPKATAAVEFVAELKRLVGPFGHLPLRVSQDDPAANAAPVTKPELCPACVVTRLSPPGRKKG